MTTQPLPAAKPTRLAQQAIAALKSACAAEPADRAFLVEERSVWQPGSWLLQRSWEALADAGAGSEALAVAAMLQKRQPLAPLQALHRLAQRAVSGGGDQGAGSSSYPVEQSASLAGLVRAELDRIGLGMRGAGSEADGQARERLLLTAATAGLVDDLPLACACLERLDQLERPWDSVFARSEWRLLLAESVARIGLHPLTMALVDNAVRRFDDAGAQFLHEVVTLVAGRGEPAGGAAAGEPVARPYQRLLQRCVETFRYATLSSLQSRRLAAVTFGQAGLVDEVLSQLAFIANVQDARRETGLSAYKDDALLRQVKRPGANSDIDFQVHTLQQAINAMPVRQIAREKRIALADQLALLGVRSDGWTAAGAATTLIALGALKYAVEVVGQVPPHDPTRPSGLLELVAGLLAVEEPGLAAEQAQAAAAWAGNLGDRNPARAITWGLAEIYLKHGEPEKALHWLAQWRGPDGLGGGLWARLTGHWRKPLNDDTLRLHSLRLAALLQQGAPADDAAGLRAYHKEVQSLVRELREWAPRLLEGEALVNFTIDGLLRPLLEATPPAGSRAEVADQAWQVLSELVAALSTTSGNKHAVHVATVATLLAQQLQMADGASPATGPALSAAETFLSQIWQIDARKGPWQVVHSIEGSIPLLLALEGPQSLAAIARAANEERCLWAQ